MPTTTDLAFSVDSKAFGAACAVAARRVPQKPEPPILGGALIETANGRVTVAAFDYDVASSATVEAPGATGGRCLVAGRLLAELTKDLPAKPATAELRAAELRLTCGSVRMSLPTMPVEDYPQLPVQPGAIGSVDAQTFAEAIERVAPAADLTGAIGVPMLTGVHLAFDPGAIRLLASNRYRGASLVIPWDAAESLTKSEAAAATALVPAAVLLDLARVIDAPEPVRVFLDGGTIGFALPRFSVTCRQLDGSQYPTNLPSQIPARAATPIVVEVAALTAAVKRAAKVLEPATPVKLVFAADGASLQVRAGGTADVSEDVTCTDGYEASVAMRAAYLLDALSMAHGRQIELTLPESRRKAIVLSVPGDESYRHFAMPVTKE